MAQVLEDRASHDISAVNSTNEKDEEAKPEFSEDEEVLIVRMYKLLGQRWALIAGRIPGRTAEEIEKYWASKHASITKTE